MNASDTRTGLAWPSRLLVVVLLFTAALVAVYITSVHLPLLSELPGRNTGQGVQRFHRISQRIRTELLSIQDRLRTIAAEDGMRSMDRTAMARIIARNERPQGRGSADFIYLRVLDGDGQCILWPTCPDREGSRAAVKREYYRVPRYESRTFVGKARPFLSPGPFPNLLTVTLSAPIPDADGAVHGVLVAGMNPNGHLRKVLQEEVDEAFPRALLLNDEQIRVVDSGPRVSSYLASKWPRHPARERATDEVQYGPFSFQGVDHFGYFARVPGTNWTLVLYSRLGSTIAIAETIVTGVPWILGAVVVALLGGMLFYISYTVRPIHRLTSAIVEFGKTGEATEISRCQATGDVREVIAAFSRMREERQQFEGELRKLARQLVDVEQHTRHEIAANLHDGVSQKLAAAKIRLELLRDKQSQMDQQEHLRIAIDLLTDCLECSTTMTSRLAEPSLHQLGLAKALANLVDFYKDGHDIEFEFTSSGHSTNLSKGVSETLYRGVRELLHNVVKHSGARHARVHLRTSGRKVWIEVQDDGMGIEETPGAPWERLNGGFGLFSLNERIRQLGGNVSIDGRNGAGCRVKIEIPLAVA